MNEAFVPSLRVTLAQQALSWEAPAANHRAFAAALAGLAGATDLVVLPEMFATGFTMDTLRCAETPDGPTSQWMIAQARSLDCALAGSVITRQGGSCFNRLLFVTPDGVAGHYDKRHLFRMGCEHEHYASGKHRLVARCTYRAARLL
jgi:predicted amidohydrolase